MGLDMYLSKKTYVGNKWKKPAERLQVVEPTTKFEEDNKTNKIKPERITYIEEEAAYWRKANAIHKWFVDNVQEGNDDCGSYYVGREQLRKLLEIVTEVLKDHDRASELLPTQEGFFFGGYDYDEYYFEYLQDTKKSLTALLKENDDGEFYYQSSW